MSFLEFNFWAFAVLTVVAGTLCVTRRNPIYSAMWLVVTLFALAALFVMLDAQFVAVLQVLVYAGGIMVLFLFVIMLLNIGRGGPGDLKGLFGAGVAVALATGLLLLLSRVTNAGPPDAIRLPPGTTAAAQAHTGLVAVVAQPLFDTYLIPFEITSMLLLAAAVGAVVLAKRRL